MNDQGDDALLAAAPNAEDAIRTKNAISMECLRHFFAAIPYGQPFELSNGMTGTLRKFVEPRERDHSNEAGVDVVLTDHDGNHVGEIEFFIRQTGWGMSLVPPQSEETT